jgi:hypothetical protein
MMGPGELAIEWCDSGLGMGKYVQRNCGREHTVYPRDQ